MNGAQAQPFRIGHGGTLDRSKPLAFTFDGKRYGGFAGDTLASALLANGVRLVGRSFKYHRPRGIVTAGGEEPCALVELRTGARREPNTKATTVELYADLIAQSQNRWPSLSFDIRRDQSTAVAVYRRRLLLQDVHVAGGLLGARLRAVHPPRGRARPAVRRAGSRSLRKGLCVLRCSCRRLGSIGIDGRARRRPRRRPRYSLRRRFSPRWTASFRAARDRRPPWRRMGRARSRLSSGTWRTYA